MRSTIPQVLLGQLDESQAHEISQVIWGFAKLGIPSAPGKVFCEAVADMLMWKMDQYGTKVSMEVCTLLLAPLF